MTTRLDDFHIGDFCSNGAAASMGAVAKRNISQTRDRDRGNKIALSQNRKHTQ